MSEINDMKKAINYTDLTIVKQYIDEQVAAAIAKFVDGEKVAKYANSADSAQSAGTAASATKATNDSDGNNIAATYLKKTDNTYESPYANRLKEGPLQAYMQLYPYAKPGYGETGYDASASKDIVKIVTQQAASGSTGELKSYDTYVDIAKQAIILRKPTFKEYKMTENYNDTLHGIQVDLAEGLYLAYYDSYDFGMFYWPNKDTHHISMTCGDIGDYFLASNEIYRLIIDRRLKGNAQTTHVCIEKRNTSGNDYVTSGSIYIAKLS